MNETMKALAEKMARKAYPITDTSTFSGMCQNAYLAGFEARDEMDERLREEHAEMYQLLKQSLDYSIGASLVRVGKAAELITKIESKNTNSI